MYPQTRLKRLRRAQLIRNLLAETNLTANNLIMPYFVIEGRNKKSAINLLSDIYRLSVDNLLKEVAILKDLGIKAILLFGLPSKKDNLGSEAYKPDGVIQKAIRAIKKEIKDIIIISDVCLCGYTSHGHCGLVKNKKIDNDATLKSIAKIALSHAQAGVDFVAPSAMADGQVKVIRETLDKNGFLDTGILVYSAKYASNFYGPFREALDSRPQFGDRKSYQMDFRNSHEALREIEQDINEGADIIMVKPALAYLDIISKAKEKFKIPLAAYNVSGEYALIKEGIKKGIVSEKDTILEILTSIKRAGADLIISYHAKEVASWLKNDIL